MTYKQHLPNFQTMIKRQSYNVTRMIKQVLCFVLWEKEENATSGHRRRQQQAVDKISGISLCSRNTQAFNFVMVNENKNPSFGNEAICYLIIMKDVTYLLFVEETNLWPHSAHLFSFGLSYSQTSRRSIGNYYMQFPRIENSLYVCVYDISCVYKISSIFVQLLSNKHWKKLFCYFASRSNPLATLATK